MHKYILKRILMMIPVLIGVVFIMFFISSLTPGDPAQIILGEGATEAAIAQVREEFGLDDPFLMQFGRYLLGIAQGDFGVSWDTQRPVQEEIFARFPNTMQLAGMGIVLALMLGIPLGILSAVKQYSAWDFGATFIGLIGVSMPNFWLGMLLIMLFTVNLGWLPATGFSEPLMWILPTFAIGTGSASIIMRMTRSSMLECIRQDYIRTARAKGQIERKVIFRHALKNALIPVTTTAGLSFGFLLGGAVLTETIFAIPGLGSFMVQSLQRRDWPTAIGGALLIAISFSIVNLLVDILYAILDPRIRSQYR
ncbi:MAG: ABC transporter permease [Defluviitaleaceae bacterium]|nr:ABC transporter permease [Defluviitaleaceae bacterium]